MTQYLLPRVRTNRFFQSFIPMSIKVLNNRAFLWKSLLFVIDRITNKSKSNLTLILFFEIICTKPWINHFCLKKKTVFKTCFVVDIYLSITYLWLRPTILPSLICGPDKANFVSILDDALNQGVDWTQIRQSSHMVGRFKCFQPSFSPIQIMTVVIQLQWLFSATILGGFGSKQQISPWYLGNNWQQLYKWYFSLPGPRLQLGVVFLKTSYRSESATPYFVFNESL